MRKRRCLSFLLYLLLLYFIAFSQIYAETQYFYDNFNGDTFGDWTRISGDWYLVDNQMLAISEQRQVLVINEDVGADAEINVDIEIESSYANTPEGQICFRFIDQNNFYFAGLGAYGYKVGIGKIVNGYAQELTGVGGRSEVMLKHLYHLKVIVAGDQIEVYLDGSLMCSITDADLSSGGFGLTPFKSKVWYDNFVVKNMSSSTVFSDDFDRDFLEGWGEADGYFFLENNVLRTLPEAKRSYIVADQSLPDDYEVEVRVKIRESSLGNREGQICVRYQDSRNYYFAGLGVYDGKVGIGKFVDGTPYKINSFGSKSQINLNTWYDLKVTVEDSEIRVYLNDELTCNVQDTSHISGKAGLTVYRSDVSFDNFGICDVPVPIIYTLSVESEYGTASGSGEYRSGTKAQFQVEPVSIPQGTDVRKMFYRWQGSNGFTSSSNPASVIIDEDIQMTAVWTTQYYVRIQSPESDAVSLESDWHNEGTILTITATTPYDESDVRYLFKNWSTSTGSTSTNKAITLTIDQPVAIVSEWDKMYSLKTTAGSGGSVTPSGRSWHSEGKTLTIKATPNNQYIFIRWEGVGDGSYSGTNPTATITLNGPITQRAIFKYEPNPTLTIDSEYGTKSGEGAYEKGSMVTFSVTPTTITKGDTRYLFQGWESDSPNGYNGPQNSATVQVSSNIIQKAIWKPQYRLKVNTVSGGTISPPTADWYDASSRVTLTATPDTRHKFSHWEIKTDKVSTEESQTLDLVIHEPVEVTPVYVLRPYYTLTIETEHGTAEGAGEYLEGQEASFNVKDTTVNDGSATRYIFQGWTSPNPEGVTSNMNQETIYMTEDITQVAQWKTEYYLRIESPIPIKGEGWYPEGKTIVLEPWETRGTIVKDVFTGWSGDYTASAKPIVVLMNSPKHIIVEYTKDYSIAFLGLGLTGLTGGISIFRIILNKRTAQALLKRQLAKDKILDELSDTIKVTPIAGLAKAHNIKEKEVTEIIQEAIDQKEIKGMLSKQADNYIPEDIIKKILRDKLK